MGDSYRESLRPSETHFPNQYRCVKVCAHVTASQANGRPRSCNRQTIGAQSGTDSIKRRGGESADGSWGRTRFGIHGHRQRWQSLWRPDGIHGFRVFENPSTVMNLWCCSAHRAAAQVPTLLRMVAGLEQFRSGNRIDGRVVNDCRPRIATSPWLFQIRALSAQTVAEHMGFCLKSASIKSRSSKVHVRKAAEILDLVTYLARSSPGCLAVRAGRRVAMGRCIVQTIQR